MKITEVKTMVVQNEEHKARKHFVGGRYFLFLQIFTDEGIVGLGERVVGNYTDPEHIKPHISLIHQLADRYVVGKDPFQIEKIWDDMYGGAHDFRHPSLYATPAMSAIDMALWDIVGKAANQPIYNLLGGKYHDKLRAYAYMPP